MTRNMNVVLACFLALGTAPAMAAEDSKQMVSGTFPRPAEVSSPAEERVHMGLNMGFNSPEGSYDSAMGFGVDVGFQPYIPYGLGAELFTTEMDADDTNNDDQRTALLAKGSYNFGGEIPVIRHSYVGLGAGPVLTGSTWDVGLAPLAGFDIPVTKLSGKDLSLGANIKYLATLSDTPDSFMTNFAVKYWY